MKRWKKEKLAVLAGLACFALSGCISDPVDPPGNPPSVAMRTPETVCASAQTGSSFDVDHSKTSKFWDLCVYTYSAQAVDESMRYFTTKLSIDPGDSDLNSTNNVKAWKKLTGLMNVEVKTAAVTLQLGKPETLDASQEVPIFTIARSSNGSSPGSPKYVTGGSDLIPYTQVDPAMGQWGFTMHYRLSEKDTNTVAGSVIDLGQQYLESYPVGGMVGAGMRSATSTVKNEINDFVSNLGSIAYAPESLKFVLDSDEWHTVDYIMVSFYDAPSSNASRKVVTTMKLIPEFRASVYTKKLKDGIPDYSAIAGSGTFGSSLDALGGSTKQAFEKAVPRLSAQLTMSDPDVFKDICLQGPAIYSAPEINMSSATDAVFATWLTLINSKSWTQKDNSGCSAIFVEESKRLGLMTYPADTVPTESTLQARRINIGQTMTNMLAVKKGLNGKGDPQRPFDAMADKVLVVQHVAAIENIPVDGGQPVSASDLLDIFKSLNGEFVGEMGFTGRASSVVKIDLKLGGKVYKSEVQWSGVEPNAKIVGLFIFSESQTTPQ